MDNTIEIMDAGFACLVEKLGVVNTERFIALIKRDSFDYTVWQREYFDGMEPGQLIEEAVKYEKEHPFKGDAIVI